MGVRDTLATLDLDSPLGVLRIAATERGVVRLAFPGGRSEFSGWLAQTFPDADRVATVPALQQACAEINGYFRGDLTLFETALDLRCGTPFQREVWQALAEIPFGQTRTYGDVAEAVGRPKAFRAVGLANGANPVPLLVPCHRVVAAGGKLGGFGGGLDAKRKLLALEQARVPVQGRLL